MLLTLFPNERPTFTDAPPEGDGAVINLVSNARFTCADTFLTLGGKTCKGSAQVPTDMLADKLSTDSLLQKIVKLSFFRAALAAGIKNPPWGALTGIRPGKIVTKLLESGKTPAEAERELTEGYYVAHERAELCLDTSAAGLRVKNALEPDDICLYIGVPFCPTRCSYCSFVSHSVEKSMKLIAPYVENLILEIEEAGKLAREVGSRVIAVYFGGGTPTTLSAEQLTELHKAIERSFDLSSVREYCVEAGRPDTITPERLDALKAFGVNRISINPQTMEDTVLEAIGRKHTAKQTADAFELAAKYSFDCVNADLIAGLPEDSAEGFRRSLDAVLSFAPENVTVHNLALKRGARLGGQSEMKLPSVDAIGEMLDYTMSTLRAHSYTPYYLYRQKFMAGGFENVGWALPGKESLYNICIMEELCTILALGGGGVSKLVNAKTGRIERIFNPKYSYEYVRGIDKILADKAKFRDFVLSKAKS